MLDGGSPTFSVSLPPVDLPKEKERAKVAEQKPADPPPPPPPTNAYHKPTAHKTHPNGPSNLIQNHQDPANKGVLSGQNPPKPPRGPSENSGLPPPDSSARQPGNADSAKAATSAADAARTVADNTARAADAATRTNQIIKGTVGQANLKAAEVRAAVDKSQSAQAPARPTEVAAGEQAKAQAHPNQEHGTADSSHAPFGQERADATQPAKDAKQPVKQEGLAAQAKADLPQAKQPASTPPKGTKSPADSNDPEKQVATAGTQPTKQGAKPAAGRPAPAAASAKGAEPSSSTAEASEAEQPQRPGAENGVPGFAEGVPTKRTTGVEFGQYLQSVGDFAKFAATLAGLSTQLTNVGNALREVARQVGSNGGDSFTASGEGEPKATGTDGEKVLSLDGRRARGVGRFRGGLRG